MLPSSEKEDVPYSVIQPAPLLQCRVGSPCGFTLLTRTRLGMQLPHGGLSVAVRTADVAEHDAAACTHMMNGGYACVFSSSLVFLLS